MTPLIEINPDLDRPALAAEFASRGRIQIRDVLTEASAAQLRDLLMTKTPWLLGWMAGDQSGRNLDSKDLLAMPREQMVAIERRIVEAVVREEFCYISSSYPLDQALSERWQPGSPHEQLVYDLRSDPFAALLRDVTGHSEIVGADGYATMYAPGHFLGRHTDEGVKWRRVVAYVLNVTVDDWLPEYGGYLTFYDVDGNVEQAFKPAFNTLNLFNVPQVHAVTRVSPFASMGRAAISGWARETLTPPRAA
jgi:hypothetical protein